jgi:hypothetical protein
MLVGVTGFGSVWRRRIRDDGSGRRRFAHASYFNTTGVMVNGRLVRRRKIAGHVRLDDVSGFNPNYPSRAIGRVFECAEPCVWKGQNKVLFGHLLPTTAKPDYFLVVTRSAEVGRLDLTASDWKSDDTLLISFSECDCQQEALLLMPAYGFVRTALGTFFLEPLALQPWTARLCIETGFGDTSCVTQKGPSN